MARKKKPSVKQYANMLDAFDFNWFMHIEMELMDDIPAHVRKKNEAKEDELIDLSQVSEIHNELYDAYYNHAINKGPRPKLVELGKDKGKTIWGIAHDDEDGMIWDWRKQHVRI